MEQVSVLFSEPKIPQWKIRRCWRCLRPGFSALQRAENSSIEERADKRHRLSGFSALQRAENSSIVFVHFGSAVVACFSALRRAENSSIRVNAILERTRHRSFSALQRAENSSIDYAAAGR